MLLPGQIHAMNAICTIKIVYSPVRRTGCAARHSAAVCRHVAQRDYATRAVRNINVRAGSMRYLGKLPKRSPCHVL